ncbi:hypothetical protein B0H10DRAFT_1964338 [Mycena sp. CBHHK59/15]|nr:hypothetical protein B0H10DRAFT_1964338 [Mycena sp. CBHHK59/15]
MKAQRWDKIITLWLKILHINPESGTEICLPNSRSFSVSDGSGDSITYELIGTISFLHDKEHFTSKILIGNTTFHYDDLKNRGSLVAAGSVELISSLDPTVVLWVYHRTSKLAQSSKPFADVVSTYNAAAIADASRERSPPINVDNNDNPPEPPIGAPPGGQDSISRIPPPLIPNPVIPSGAAGLAPFPLDLSTPLGAPLPEVPPPIIEWKDELIGEYLMFKTGPGSSFYPAHLERVTSTGEVQVKWYQDNIYERRELPLESEFLATKQECANIAVLIAEETYDRGNVGLIKWPPRLAEDARELYTYENPEISDPLFHARESVLDIVIGSPSASHPIRPDYEQWMASGGELRDARRASDFGSMFYSAQILPGDASLIEPHTDYIMQQILPDIPADTEADTPTAVSETLRRRVTTLAPILFELLILRIYLCCSAADDLQIYWLTRSFDKDERKKLVADDPMYLAKTGYIHRYMTEPELALQAAQERTDQLIPPKWCKIGRRVSKAAAGRIPANFIFARILNGMGEEYVWHDNTPTGIPAQEDALNFPPSSPFSQLPIEVLPMDQQHSPAPELTSKTPETLKRKFNGSLGPGVKSGTLGSGEVEAERPAKLRRSARNQSKALQRIT